VNSLVARASPFSTFRVLDDGGAAVSRAPTGAGQHDGSEIVLFRRRALASSALRSEAGQLFFLFVQS